MIEESYVSFDTAKMLKEVGFHIQCIKVYNKHSKKLAAWSYPTDSNQHVPYYSAPTQALAARWLREVYHIHIMITPMIDGWMVELFDLKKYQYILTNKDANTDSYEQAFELGLQEAIKLIKK